MPIIVRNVRMPVKVCKTKIKNRIQHSTHIQLLVVPHTTVNSSQFTVQSQFTSWKNYPTNISDASYLHLDQIKRDVFILFVWEAIHGNRILKQKCSTIFTSIFSWDEVVMYVHISFCGNFWHGEEDGRNIYGRSCDHNCIFWQERQGLGQWPRHEDGALSAG